MFKALLSVQLSGLKSRLTGALQTKKKASVGKGIFVVLLFAYVLLAFGFLFYTYFNAIAVPFYEANAGWLYFTMLILLSFALMFIGSIFTAKAQLFEAQDNELLLSMPIAPRLILSARLLTLLLLNLLMELIVAAGALLPWFRQYSLPTMGIVALVVVLLLLPLLTLGISALFGWLISLLTRRVRKKSLMSVIFSLLFLGAYFYGFSKVNSAITQLIAHVDDVAQALGAVTPLYWMGNAITAGNMSQLCLSALVLLVPFLLALWLLSKTFVKTATTKHGFSKIRYVDKGQKVSSPFRALSQKEMQRFLSSPNYVLNGSLGVVFLVIGAVLLVIKQDSVLAFFQTIPGFDRLASIGLLLLLCLVMAMNTISAPSVSLEGKSIWIPQSLPISTKVILQSKLMVHLSICLPAALIAMVAVLIVLRPTGVLLVCTCLLPLVFTVFSAMTGLYMNLHMVNLKWVNEAQVVKNSASVGLSLLIGWFSVLLPGAGLVFATFSMPADAIAWLLLAYTAMIAIVAFLQYRWIITKGASRFLTLSC